LGRYRYLLFILQICWKITGTSMQSIQSAGNEGIEDSVLEAQSHNDDDGICVDNDDDTECWTEPLYLPADDVNHSDHSTVSGSCSELSDMTATSASENVQTECQSSKG